jgi:2-oxoglutarate ferredoxin oxidoreductase subunit delta
VHTGNEETMKTTTEEKQRVKGTIVINRELCKGCLYCVDACPRQAIAVEEHFNTQGYFPARFLHADRCTGCGFCALVCPDIAIEVWREEA